MSLISEKVSYLKGLAEGLNISEKTPEGKIISEIINVLGSISDELENHEDTQDELFDKVFDLEDTVYGEEDDDDFNYIDDDEEFAVKCPSCNEEFFLTYDDLESDDDIVCPYCNQEIELDLSCDGDCSSCGEDCE
ncbi:MAG: hypothetical protein IJQ50_07110 [Clostridia bacterium]|nr:hypothetical protein [Clostridia bacterium]